MMQNFNKNGWENYEIGHFLRAFKIAVSENLKKTLLEQNLKGAALMKPLLK